MSEDEWDAVFRVHAKGTFMMPRLAPAHWRERSAAGEAMSARIINTSSASGFYGKPGQANYDAAKMAVTGFTVIVVVELARYGVTVNAMGPAAMTRMTAGVGTDPRHRSNPNASRLS
jgi:NAD(P)-dependent dehydrogenase (short-subunit alcohol dehydrogenase family)